MKTVIIGANGVIGGTLRAAFPGCVGLTSKKIPSLTTVKYDMPSLREHVVGADTVIYCVGVSKFAECEEFPEQSLFLNARLPQEILKNLSANQNFVYFGSPIAVYNFGSAQPNNYALHKKMAEDGLQRENVIIIRPSKVIESVAIIRDWKATLSKGETITAFSDQAISPINTALLADQLLRLIRGKCSGAYNFSAGDRLTYLDLAKHLCAHLNFDPEQIEEKSARADNPFFFEQDILDCSAAQRDTGYVAPLSADIVDKYFRAIA